MGKLFNTAVAALFCCQSLFAQTNFKFEKELGGLGQTPPVIGFYSPYDVTIDPQKNIFVSDGDDHIYKFNADGNYLFRFGYSLGRPDNAGFSSPAGLGFDSEGNIYVADDDNARIQKLDANGNFITKWGKYGSGNGQFRHPKAIAVDNDNNIYVADGSNARVQKFSSDTTYITQWNVTNVCTDIELHNNSLFVLTHSKVLQYSLSGTLQTSFDIQGGMANAFAIDDNGIYVLTYNLPNKSLYSIQKYSGTGTLFTSWGTYGDADNQIGYGYGLAIGPNGNLLMANTEFGYVKEFTTSGSYVGKLGSSTKKGLGLFALPIGVATDSQKNIYVSDLGNRMIQKFSVDGTYLSQWKDTAKSSYPSYITINLLDEIFIIDDNLNEVVKYNTSGTILKRWGGKGAADNQFGTPGEITTDNISNVYVIDKKYKLVKKFATDGAYLLKWGGEGNAGGQFISPTGILATANGTIYVTDPQAKKIQQFNSSGTWLATWNFSTTSPAFYPYSITQIKNGNFVVADLTNNQFVEIDASGNILARTTPKLTDHEKSAGIFGICTDAGNRIIIADTENTRVQIFNPDLKTTGLTNIQKTSSPLIYPNPSTETITINTDKPIEWIKVTSMDGQTESYTSSSFTTKLKGLVVVEVKTFEGLQRQKVIIQ